jgi:hypothetical protein
VTFTHRDHLELAWRSVGRVGLAGALIEVPAFLRGLTAAAGQPERYHETVTLGFLLLVADRYEAGEDFEAFCARNPDLFGPVLRRWWRTDTLASERARTRFVFPDVEGAG